MVRGVSGLRLVVARLEVGSPLTMYPVDLAEGTSGLPLRPMLTNGALPREGTCVNVVTTEGGNG